MGMSHNNKWLNITVISTSLGHDVPCQRSLHYTWVFQNRIIGFVRSKHHKRNEDVLKTSALSRTLYLILRAVPGGLLPDTVDSDKDPRCNGGNVDKGHRVSESSGLSPLTSTKEWFVTVTRMQSSQTKQQLQSIQCWNIGFRVQHCTRLFVLIIF